jgi:hypothetical protein
MLIYGIEGLEVWLMKRYSVRERFRRGSGVEYEVVVGLTGSEKCF